MLDESGYLDIVLKQLNVHLLYFLHILNILMLVIANIVGISASLTVYYTHYWCLW